MLDEKLALSLQRIFCQYQDLCSYETLLGKVHSSITMQLTQKMCFAEKNFEIGKAWLGFNVCVFSSLNLRVGGIFLFCCNLNETLK